ncbi:MAG: serine/threonine-protein kinase [Ignavibacteriales bacterium]
MFAKGTVLYTAFEEYTVKDGQIGQGGNGKVFHVVSSENESFAIKAIDKSTTTKDKIKRFKNEINFCLKNDHPNIIKVVDYGVYKSEKLDCLFYVMPYYNCTLRDEIKNGIEPERVIKIFSQILRGLDFAHQKGVWHRDIKPENILYDTNNGMAIIADFGIAHFCSDDLITAIETKVGERLANFIYAAPEQGIKGKIVDGKADVFALGLILNEMFTKTVISGSKYKKILDCCEKYRFLDNLVDEMISQNPENRLYPIQKIAIEISALLEQESDKEELKKITERQVVENTEEDPLFNAPVVTNIEYENNHLIFYLDKRTNPTWNNILISGQYDHSNLSGYTTRSFTPRFDENKNCTIFLVHVPQHDENSIKEIVRFFKSWLPIASSKYAQEEKQNRARKVREEIEKREKEIKAKESEMRIKDQLKTLI